MRRVLLACKRPEQGEGHLDPRRLGRHYQGERRPMHRITIEGVHLEAISSAITSGSRMFG